MTIQVAVGVLKNAQGEVLLAQRAANSHQGGLWEFPGGKIEPGEQVEQALQRELHEELGVRVEHCRPLIHVSHRYRDREVALDTWLIEGWEGEPYGKEGQPLAWVLPERLSDWPMPEADKPILRALDLPDRYVITPPGCDNPALFLQQLRRVLESGVSLVQFRVFGLPEQELEKLAADACLLCNEYGARMLLNGSMALATQIGAHGLHLDRRRLQSLNTRDTYPDLLLAASCHNVQELQSAQAAGVDFAVLSPVLPTLSHPDAEILGWDGFGSLCRDVSVPVYALGGMTAEMLEQSWARGAQGIAGIRGLWPSI
ncbi:Nudix family hydrolase [Thiolapillus sp.]